MTRTGQCNQCGTCCKLAGYITKLTAEHLEWAQARGFEVNQMPGSPYAQVLIPHTCPHLRDGTACDLHGDNKPKTCREFPTVPEHLLPGCGFSFEEVN